MRARDKKVTLPISQQEMGSVTFCLAAVMIAIGMLASASGAQETKVVTVGPEYAARRVQRIWLGDGYRDLWTTPVTVAVLDLKKEAGGLTPVRQVGKAPSVALALTGADGRSYTFRSLHKASDRMLPEPLRGTIVGTIARDLTSGTHPAAGLIAPVLAEAAGVPHTSARLVVMPDDPALGAFASGFANLIGTIEEYPMPAVGANPGFMGATEIIPSTRMWKKWMEGPENADRPVSRTSAPASSTCGSTTTTAIAGNGAGCGCPGHDAWQPLPEDFDFVLVRRDGIVARSIRSQVPQYLMFSENYPARLDGALLNSAEMDRWILAGTSAADFEGDGARSAVALHRRGHRARTAPDASRVVRQERRRNGGSAPHTPRRPRRLHPARVPLLRPRRGHSRHRPHRAGQRGPRHRRLDRGDGRPRPTG